MDVMQLTACDWCSQKTHVVKIEKDLLDFWQILSGVIDLSDKSREKVCCECNAHLNDFYTFIEECKRNESPMEELCFSIKDDAEFLHDISHTQWIKDEVLEEDMSEPMSPTISNEALFDANNTNLMKEVLEEEVLHPGQSSSVLKDYDSESDDMLQNTTEVKTKSAKAANLDSLPFKSRDKYEQQYALFMDWRIKKTMNISENTLLAYFVEKSKVLKPSTLWSIYSMLKATLAVKKNIHINRYTKLIAFIKNKSIGFKPKKSKTFSKTEIDSFLLEAPNDQFLMFKVALIIGVAGGCRSDELCKMSIQDIQDQGSVLIVSIPDTKTHRKRMFTITNGTTKNIQLYRKYRSLRPARTTHCRLFLSYRRSKCTVQPVGINSFSKIPGLIAKYLNLRDVDSYTGHCFRRTSDSLKTRGDWYVDDDEIEVDDVNRKCNTVQPLMFQD